MFFMLERERNDGRWEELGIVAAADIEAAAKKLGREIKVEKEAAIPFGFLQTQLQTQGGKCSLSFIPEINTFPEK